MQNKISSVSITHDGVMGEVNEQHFIEALRKYLPNRYAVDSAIIIDSNGCSSDQIDLVIFDRQYTPTLLDQQDHRFIPAEAVYGIFEVKPTINKVYLEYAAIKAASVGVLERTSVPISHAGSEYEAKELFPIISGIVAVGVDWAQSFESKSFNENLNVLCGNKSIDCGLALSGGCFDSFDGNLKLGPNNSSLVYFIFRLLQKLRGLGTVPAVDWNRYALVMSAEDA
jgi:hypothetical protein